jgi:hypothetical protein
MRRLIQSLLLAALLLFGGPALASESELEEAPPPQSVEEIEGRVEKQFEEPPEADLPPKPGPLDAMPPFLRDATYRTRLRTRYLNRRRFDDGRTETWAGGGSLLFRSGWWLETVGAELEYFTSQRLKGDEDRDGAKHLEPGQHGFGVLGVANLRLRWRNWLLTGYRQRLDLPYLNGNDSRMVPNTFEAVTARYESEAGSFAFIGGHTWRIKPRDSDEFISFPEVAGEDEDRGISFLAFKLDPTPKTYLGLFGYYGEDMGTLLYAEGSWTRELPWDVLGRIDGQGTYVNTTGEQLVSGGENTDTWFAGLRLAASRGPWIAGLSYTHMDDGGPILGRFGSNPSYLDRMQHSFTRAGEEAVGVGVTYNFADHGLAGWALTGSATQGWDARDPTGNLGDRFEADLTLDYRPSEGPLNGLWFRVRGALLYDDDADRTQNEVRIELQYDFDLF